MKKQNERKISLIKCFKIFDGLKLPWGLLITAFIFTIFSAWAALMTVTFSGNAVDASGEIPTAELVKYISATAVSLLLIIVAGICNSLAQAKIQYLLRNKLWNRIMVTKQKNYDLDGGESLVSRVTSDCEFTGMLFATVFNIINVVIGSVMYLVQLYFISKKILTWVLVFIPLSLLLGIGYTYVRFWVSVKTQKKLSDATAYLAERTKDLNLIKTCNAQAQELEKGRMFFKEQYKAQLQVGYAAMLNTVIGTILDVISKVVPFAVGAVLVANGEITVGILVTVNTLFGNITGVFKNLLLYAGDFKQANGALARVAMFFEEDEEDVDTGIVLEQARDEDIRFEQVQFAYKDKMVIKNFSCLIPKNKVTAIVGTNGSGKSTMLKLLTRLYEPNEGVIRFGGNDAAEYSLHSWRKQICLIAQGSPMMEGTIRENICYGREDTVSEEELMRVAKLSHVYDFVKDLPNGFDSEVTAGGGNFSGGQRQCIAIARAMLSKSEYLLLDESTSNLDVKREKDVMEALNAAMEGRTTIIIAHSLAAIRNADHVIVINKGCLESEGTPAQILEQTDNYLQKMMNRKRLVNAMEM